MIESTLSPFCILPSLSARLPAITLWTCSRETDNVNTPLSLHQAHRDLLALVVRPPGQGDPDGAAAELPVEDDDHDLVRRGPALLQRLVGFIDQILEFL